MENQMTLLEEAKRILTLRKGIASEDVDWTFESIELYSSELDLELLPSGSKLPEVVMTHTYQFEVENNRAYCVYFIEDNESQSMCIKGLLGGNELLWYENFSDGGINNV